MCVYHVLSSSQVAESLMLTDAEVIKGLAGLMEDHSWKVKAHAIRGEEREREGKKIT